MDNATPAGTSVAVDVLLRLSAFTGESSYRERADTYLQPLIDLMVQHPQAFGHVLGAVDFALSPVKELAVLVDGQHNDVQPLLDVINARYLPNSVLASASIGDERALSAIALLADRPLKDQRATAYVCQNFTCQAPVTEPEALARLL